MTSNSETLEILYFCQFFRQKFQIAFLSMKGLGPSVLRRWGSPERGKLPRGLGYLTTSLFRLGHDRLPNLS